MTTLKKVMRFKKEFLIVIIASLVVGIVAFHLRKSEIKLTYPNVEQLPAEFTTLNCSEVSETYMRAWPQNSDLPGDADNSVQLSASKSNTKVTLTYKDSKVTFNGDYVWNLENRLFAVDINNSYRMAGTIATSKEDAPRYDIAGSFMLDKKTSLLILSDMDTMITQNESFGTRSRLFTCKDDTKTTIGKSGHSIETAPRDKIVTYLVEKNDTLDLLANKWGVSKDTIRWANNLLSDNIKPGQNLLILPVSGIAHVVVKGDTVESLSRRYHSTPQKIVDFPYNKFSNTENFALIEGETIIIPDGKR